MNTTVEHLEESKPSLPVMHGKVFLIGPDPVLSNLTHCVLKCVACQIVGVRVVVLKFELLCCMSALRIFP